MRTNYILLAGALALGLVQNAVAAPESAAPTPPIAAPQDVAYPGVITLDIDATDVTRGIFNVRQTIPISGPGQVTLLYPEWLPGTHAPRGTIDKIANLQIRSGDTLLAWRRDPVNVYAFHVEAPAGARELHLSFQFLSPTQSNQGRIVATHEMLNLQWNQALLYPAGHYAARIRFVPSVTLPEDWRLAGALDGAVTNGATTRFAETDLETLVDSPLFAGKHFTRITLAADGAPVHLNIVADRPDQLEATDEQINAHRNLVTQARRVFGPGHFDRYEFLFALTDRMGGIGLEHHRSSENGVAGGYFSEWDKAANDRDLLPHEMVHSWNGKYRRPADLWTPNYDVPMRDSLLWVYEGQTQYWGQVLTARAGLWSRDQALEQLAYLAATYQARAGRSWRPLIDTTNDPIISSRRPQAWRSWSRNEDYYSEGLMIWLDADTLIREQTRGRRSLDDFARAFFGGAGPDRTPVTYDLDDVVAALNAVAPYDWASFLNARVNAINPQAPMDGFTRGGYRLIFTEERTEYQRDAETYDKFSDFMYSIGVMLNGGDITQVQWDGPAFNAGITIGTTILAVNGESFSAETLRRAITSAKDGATPITLMLKNGDRYRTIDIAYHGGLRYPRFERIPGTPDRLGDILAPRR